MKALVLSGGAGTRLRPITHTSAKQLVPIANKSVLFYGLEAIRDAGITDVGVIIGQTGDEIRAALGDGSRFGVNITYIPQEAPLGLAHCVMIARDFLGDDDFVMYLGDNFIVGGITGLVDEFRRTRPEAQILLTRVSNPSEFGIATLDADGVVVHVEEKPAAPRSDYALVGVYMFTPVVHDIIRGLSPSARGELEITDAIDELIRARHDVRSHVISGYWKDTGRVDDMLECNRIVLESIDSQIDGQVDDTTQVIGRVVVGTGAKVVRSRLFGPLVIGEGTTVEDACVGPFTSVGADCELRETEVENSIVMGGSSICGVRRVQGSLIGREVQVEPAVVAPHAHQLILGDNSRVRIEQ
jgi:glucose-1-phosphate thymidylyltransferase